MCLGFHPAFTMSRPGDGTRPWHGEDPHDWARRQVCVYKMDGCFQAGVNYACSSQDDRCWPACRHEQSDSEPVAMSVLDGCTRTSLTFLKTAGKIEWAACMQMCYLFFGHNQAFLLSTVSPKVARTDVIASAATVPGCVAAIMSHAGSLLSHILSGWKQSDCNFLISESSA